MAKQLITIGTPGAGGGDPAHAAFKKINDNATELYNAAIPDTEAKKVQARTNLGLGSAATKNVGTAAGNVMEVGAFGLGKSMLFFSGAEYIPSFFTGSPSQGLNAWMSGITMAYDSAEAWQLAKPTVNNKPVFRGTFYNGSAYVYSDWFEFLTKANTATDGNGFIKAASPVGDLYADRLELNFEAKEQTIEFEKLGVGDYLIKGSTGFANNGWYIEQPKDSNGNVYHAVEYGTYDNGDLWIKTYNQKLEGTRIVADHDYPVDIKEGRFITVRLNELPKDITAPDPAIVDSEGNLAPTRYHELVNGVWIISDEHVALVEQERLASMKPLKRRQFRLTLAMNGFDLAAVEALINQIEDPMQRTIAQIEWQDATDFERTNPTLIMMATLLGLSVEQVDQLWAFGLAL